MNNPGISLNPNRAIGAMKGPPVREPSQAGWGGIRLALYRHFEAIFALGLLLSLLFIQTVVVHKFAFLMFYFIPVLLMGFYVSTREAVLTSLLITGFVTYLVLLDPFEKNARAFEASTDFWNLLIWACFLILTGALVGRLQDNNRVKSAQLREAYIGMVAVLTKYLEAADMDTKTHSERVAAVSAILARRLGLDAAHVDQIRTAALLHDIGKTEVLDLIRKAGALEPDEKARVDWHAQLGAELLVSAGSLFDGLVPLIREHHRRYEEGGEGIPVGARIIAVADAYDAIVSDRPYRAGRSHWQALAALEEAASGQFDPGVVQAFMEAEQLVLSVYSGEVNPRSVVGPSAGAWVERHYPHLGDAHSGFDSAAARLGSGSV